MPQRTIELFQAYTDLGARGHMEQTTTYTLIAAGEARTATVVLEVVQTVASFPANGSESVTKWRYEVGAEALVDFMQKTGAQSCSGTQTVHTSE